MRIVFCGSGSFALPCVRAISGDARHELGGVVTQPARPAGRGGCLRPTPVADLCRQLGAPVHEIEKINRPESVELLASLRADVMVVADYGQFIRGAARATAARSVFNVHGSVLPELRGAAPVNWAIIRGYPRTGVTTFELVDAMDAGPVYLTAQADIGPTERADELRARLAELGAELAVRTLELIESGARPSPQDESRATLAPMLTREHAVLDLSAPTDEVRGLINGVWPWPGARATLSRGRGPVEVVLARAAPADGPAAGAPGEIDRDMCVSCGQGRLRILELQPAGKRLMDWKAFVNGYRVTAGDKLLPPGPPEASPNAR
jgi:methionyl-tRNA formyltransferase